MKLLGEAPLRKKTGGPRTASAQQGYVKLQTPPPPSGPGFWGGGGQPGTPAGGRRHHSRCHLPCNAKTIGLHAYVPTGRLSFPPSCYPHYVRAIKWYGLVSRSVCFFTSRRALSESSACLARLQGYTWYTCLQFGLLNSEKPRDVLQQPTDGPPSSICIALLKSLNGEIENPPKLPTENKKTSGRDRLFP